LSSDNRRDGEESNLPIWRDSNLVISSIGSNLAGKTIIAAAGGFVNREI